MQSKPAITGGTGHHPSYKINNYDVFSFVCHNIEEISRLPCLIIIFHIDIIQKVIGFYQFMPKCGQCNDEIWHIKSDR